MLQSLLPEPTHSGPAWLNYFDEAYLSAMFAHCFKEIGRPSQALDWAQRSLRMREGYARGRVFNLALMGSVLADMGEVEQACRVGIEATELASGIDSHRASGYLADFRRRLGRFTGHPAVAGYDDLVTDLTPEA